MKIKKVAQTPGVLATVSTSKIDSDKDTYSCNYLNDNATVVSSTEPSDGKVWLQKGKNLFSKNNAFMCPTLYLSNGVAASSNTRNSFYIKVLPNTTYTISKAYVSLFRIGVCKTIPIVGTSFSNYKYPSGVLSEVITTGNDDNYLFVSYYDTSTDSGNVTEQQVLDSIQIEQGEVATPYEPFIPKKIHTKTANGYEEFYNEENREVYSTSEQRIGTWVDGKPIYRKVISSTLASSINTNKVIGSIPNFETIVRFEGYFIPYGNYYFKFPFAYNNEDISINFYRTDGTINESHNYSGVNDVYCYAIVEYTKTTD